MPFIVRFLPLVVPGFVVEWLRESFNRIELDGLGDTPIFPVDCCCERRLLGRRLTQDKFVRNCQNFQNLQFHISLLLCGTLCTFFCGTLFNLKKINSRKSFSQFLSSFNFSLIFQFISFFPTERVEFGGALYPGGVGGRIKKMVEPGDCRDLMDSKQRRWE